MSPADHTASTLGTLILLGIALFAGFAGLGILGGLGKSSKPKEDGGGLNIGKILLVMFGGLLVVGWLSAPGTGQDIAGTINAMWGNLLVGVQPVISIAFQLTMLLAVGYIAYLFWRRRR